MTNEEIKTLIKNYYSSIDEDTCTMFELNMKNSILDTNGEVKSYISERILGTALYAIFNAVKETRRLEAKKKLAELNNLDEYYGAVGDKFKGKPVHLHLIKYSSFETQFGWTFIWNMKDNDGRTFVWFSSSSPAGMVMRIREGLISEMRSLPTGFEDYRNSITEWKCVSTDENFIKLWNENHRLYEIEKQITDGVPVEFDLVGGSIKEHKEYTDRDGITVKQTVVTRCKLNW